MSDNKFLLIIIDPDGREAVYPQRYNFYAQAEAYGLEYTRKAPAYRFRVQAVGSGLLGRLDKPASQA